MAEETQLQPFDRLFFTARPTAARRRSPIKCAHAAQQPWHPLQAACGGEAAQTASHWNLAGTSTAQNRDVNGSEHIFSGLSLFLARSSATGGLLQCSASMKAGNCRNVLPGRSLCAARPFKSETGEVLVSVGLVTELTPFFFLFFPSLSFFLSFSLSLCLSQWRTFSSSRWRHCARCSACSLASSARTKSKVSALRACRVCVCVCVCVCVRVYRCMCTCVCPCLCV